LYHQPSQSTDTAVAPISNTLGDWVHKTVTIILPFFG
jgi:hypothetical protein